MSPMSEHLRLEIAVAHVRGRPLDHGAPVPGCPCESCTGIPEDHPARVPAWRLRDPERAARGDRERRRAWERRVDDARNVTVAQVAWRLGCGEPVKQGREMAVCCPLHPDSRPSLRIAADGRRWFCDPCAQGGDAIALYQRARRVTFTEAVRELAA